MLPPASRLGTWYYRLDDASHRVQHVVSRTSVTAAQDGPIRAPRQSGQMDPPRPSVCSGDEGNAFRTAFWRFPRHKSSPLSEFWG